MPPVFRARRPPPAARGTLLSSHPDCVARFEQIRGLSNLSDVLFFGNPIYGDMSVEETRLEVLRRLPQVNKIDGVLVKPQEREAVEGS